MSENEKYHSSFTAADIRRYLDGKMLPGEMHELEAAALDDPFLREAIDGFEGAATMSGSDQVFVDIESLEARLAQRITGRQMEPPQGKVVSPTRFRWLKVAVAASVIATAGLFTYRMLLPENATDKFIVQQHKLPAPESIPKSETQGSIGPVSGDTLLLSTTRDTNRSATVYQSEKDQQILPVHKENSQRDNGATTKDKASTEMEVADALIKSTEPPATRADNMLHNAEIEEELSKPNAGEERSEKNAVSPSTPAVASASKSKSAQQTEAAEQGRKRSAPIKTSRQTDIDQVSGYSAKIKADLAKKESTSSVLPVSQAFTTGVLSGTDTMQYSRPVPGWLSYQEYVKKNQNRRSASEEKRGFVRLAFHVDQQGNASDIMVTHSLSAFCDAEALRLLRDGPRWTMTQVEKQYVSLSVQF